MMSKVFLHKLLNYIILLVSLVVFTLSANGIINLMNMLVEQPNRIFDILCSLFFYMVLFILSCVVILARMDVIVKERETEENKNGKKQVIMDKTQEKKKTVWGLLQEHSKGLVTLLIICVLFDFSRTQIIASFISYFLLSSLFDKKYHTKKSQKQKTRRGLTND